MTRKRFVKLCMGELGYTRNEANEAASMRLKGQSYETLYNLIKGPFNMNELITACNKAVSSMVETVSRFANAALKAGAAAVDTFNEVYTK